MKRDWRQVAERAVAGLGVQSGDRVLIRDHAGRRDVLEEMLTVCRWQADRPTARQPEGE